MLDQGLVVTVLNLREEYRLRVFKNTVLKKTYGHKSVGTVRVLTKLHTEEFVGFILLN